MDWYDTMKEATPPLLTGLLGSAVHLLNNQKTTIRSFLVGLVTALFVCWLVFLAMRERGYSEVSMMVTVGMTGYCAHSVLAFLERAYMRKFRSEL